MTSDASFTIFCQLFGSLLSGSVPVSLFRTTSQHRLYALCGRLLLSLSSIFLNIEYCRSVKQILVIVVDFVLLVRLWWLSEFGEQAGPECGQAEYGCCPDGVTAASGPDYEGCMSRDRVPQGIDCALSRYGCCPDGHTAADGPHDEGCPTVDCTVLLMLENPWF